MSAAMFIGFGILLMAIFCLLMGIFMLLKVNMQVSEKRIMFGLQFFLDSFEFVTIV